MIEWTGESNGHLLVVKMDKDEILRCIDSHIKSWEDTKAAIAAAQTDEERETLELDERYERCRIGSYNEEYMTIDECIADLNDFKKAVEDFAELSADEVLAKCARKRNGTFNRSTRPTIARLNHGTLYEDAYGWSTDQVRIRPLNDTEAEVEIDHTVVKW